MSPDDRPCQHRWTWIRATTSDGERWVKVCVRDRDFMVRWSKVPRP